MNARPRRSAVLAVAVGITALAPFVQPVGSAVGPYALRFAGILIAACAWLWAWVAEPGAFRPGRRLLWAVAAVTATTLLASAASRDPGAALTFGAEGSLMAAPAWLGLLAVFAFASSVRPSPEVASAVRLVLAWAAISATMVLWERVSGAPQVTGGFGNANYASAALVATVPLALFFAQSDPDVRVRSIWRYLALGTIAAVVAAGSLAGHVGLAATIAGVCLLAPRSLLGLDDRVGRRVAGAILAVAALAAAVVVLALSSSVLPDPVDGFVSTRILGTTAQTRLEMWRMALGIFAERPVLGVGPDVIQLASQAHLTERLLTLESGGFSDYRVLMKDPHSVPLLALASLGVAGAAALIWLGVEWVRSLKRLLSLDGRDTRSAAFRVALATGVFGHVAALLFMPWAVAFGPLAPLLAGLAVSGAQQEEGSGAGAQPALRAAAAALATLLAAWLVGAAAYGDSRIAAARGRSSPELARAQYAAGARVQPTRPYLAYEALYASGFLASEGLESLSAYRRAVEAAPRSVRDNAGFLANLVQPSLDEAYLTGRTDLAWERAQLEPAAKAAPNHPDVVLEQAHLALLAGDVREAGRHLARTERFSPNAPRHLLYSYYLALATGDTKAAEALLPRIEATGPGHSRLAKGWDR